MSSMAVRPPAQEEPPTPRNLLILAVMAITIIGALVVAATVVGG
ncbi:hypothetical protein AB0N05_07680 [Nocardia sp. NPDC051030]